MAVDEPSECPHYQRQKAGFHVYFIGIVAPSVVPLRHYNKMIPHLSDDTGTGIAHAKDSLLAFARAREAGRDSLKSQSDETK